MPDGRPEMSGNSGKSASFIKVLALIMLVGAIWLHFTSRIGILEERIVRLESDSEVLSPLSKLMRGHQPGRATPHSYEAVQATGATNVPESGVDSALAWCPDQENKGMEWLELHYAKPVSATEIRIHASFNPGAIVRVLGGTAEGDLREIWSGTSPAEPVQTIPLSTPAEISRIKLELDTSKVPGWNQIDAVAIVDGAGNPTWADTASSSSYWGQPQIVPAK